MSQYIIYLSILFTVEGSKRRTWTTFLAFLSLRHSDGSPVSLNEWNTQQVALLKDWASGCGEKLKISEEEGYKLWMNLFAARIRSLCEEGVAFEAIGREWQAFQRRVLFDFAQLKLFLSEAQEEDVGIQGALQKVHFQVMRVVGEGDAPNQIIMEVDFPFVNNPLVVHTDRIQMPTVQTIAA